jgi:hypothetical protein
LDDEIARRVNQAAEHFAQAEGLLEKLKVEDTLQNRFDTESTIIFIPGDLSQSRKILSDQLRQVCKTSSTSSGEIKRRSMT